MYWLYHYDASDNSEQNIVGVIMPKKAHSVLIEWKPVSDRMIYARFKGKFFNISVISVYIPTLLTYDRDKVLCGTSTPILVVDAIYSGR